MLYDAFLFLNELDLLELRLHTLAEKVDRFIIVESNQSFSTRSTKPGFIFERNRQQFAEFSDRIIYIKLENEFETGEQRSRRTMLRRLWRFLTRYNPADVNEARHRNAIMRGLQEAQEGDYVLVSDIDEIIDPACLQSGIEALGSSPVVTLELKMYRYFVNNREQGVSWTLPKLTTCGTLRSLTPHGMRGRRNCPTIRNAGWHFSSVGGMERFHFKIQSDLHHDRCYQGPFLDLEEMKRLFHQRVIEERRDLFDFNDQTRYEFEEIDDSFPPYLVAHRERFAHLIHHPGPRREGRPGSPP